jgi:hypothetical protein
MKQSLKLDRPGSFWLTAMLSTLVLLGLVYPWLDAHPELLAIPIVGGTVLTFCSQFSAVRMRTRRKTTYSMISGGGSDVPPEQRGQTETASTATTISTSLH